ncbi:MAG: hypothetical protein M3405_01410 [Acidobacteriota bacterium]|jgi:hypothetical protein|nr:hypothetical protein [Acidobacteriota bacterium]
MAGGNRDDVWFSGNLAKNKIPKLVTRIFDERRISIDERYQLWKPTNLVNGKYVGLSTGSDFFSEKYIRGFIFRAL